jgi:hypothetical protein
VPTSTVICPFCGFQYPKKVAKEVDLANIMFSARDGMVKKVKPFNQMSVQELIDYREEKGVKQAWLWLQLYLRGGVTEIERVGVSYKWTRGTIEKAKIIAKKMARK